jgi:hypothetical protein
VADLAAFPLGQRVPASRGGPSITSSNGIPSTDAFDSMYTHFIVSRV